MEQSDFLNDILGQVLELTGQHELEALAVKLTETVTYLFPCNDFRVYFLDQSSDVFEMIHLHRHSAIKKADEIEIKDKELLQHLVLLNSDLDYPTIENNLCIYPIMSGGRIYSAVVIENVDCEHENLAVFTYLLGIYANQMQLLVKSISDHLTGLFNRQKLNQTLHNILSAEGCLVKNRENDLVTHKHYLALFDIDFFKRINDAHGHLIGDEVLVLLAQKTESSFREGDMVFRYGGEEFAIVLKFVTEQDAFKALERFRESVAKMRFPSSVEVTISAGITELEAGIQSVTALKRADNALYYSKEHGRNRLSSYEQLIHSGAIKEVVDHSVSDIELF